MVSVIIVSFNTRDLTRACLASLKEKFADANVIVVDNASRDESCEMIRAEFPDVRLIELDDNVGFGGANNTGYKHCGLSEHVILLNSDTVIDDESLQTCIDWMDRHPEAGACSPRLIGMDNQPQRAQHPFPTLSDVVRKCFRRSSLYETEIDIDNSWLAGTCLVLRREAVEQAGGLFDPKLFIYWEDADLSSRLLRHGWKLRTVAEAQIRHYGGASGGGPDASRRPDLHAWYTYGRHHWFRKHRTLPVYAAICLMDFLDVFRTTIRATLRKGRRAELAHARTMVSVLWRRATGRQPELIGS